MEKQSVVTEQTAVEPASPEITYRFPVVSSTTPATNMVVPQELPDMWDAIARNAAILCAAPSEKLSFAFLIWQWKNSPRWLGGLETAGLTDMRRFADPFPAAEPVPGAPCLLGHDD